MKLVQRINQYGLALLIQFFLEVDMIFGYKINAYQIIKIIQYNLVIIIKEKAML